MAEIKILRLVCMHANPGANQLPCPPYRKRTKPWILLTVIPLIYIFTETTIQTFGVRIFSILENKEINTFIQQGCIKLMCKDIYNVTKISIFK